MQLRYGEGTERLRERSWNRSRRRRLRSSNRRISAERLTVFSKCIIMKHLRYGEVAERLRERSWNRSRRRRLRSSNRRISAERLTVFSKNIIMEHLRYGEVAERFNAAVLKTVVGASLPGVRISPSPPLNKGAPFMNCTRKVGQ